jgi:hypothetical protein
MANVALYLNRRLRSQASIRSRMGPAGCAAVGLGDLGFVFLRSDISLDEGTNPYHFFINVTITYH